MSLWIVGRVAFFGVKGLSKIQASTGARFPWLLLTVQSLLVLVVNGYHLGVEDAEIYLPAAKRLRDARLYPYASEFFLAHGHLSLFSPLLALSSWMTHLSMDWTVLLWYLVTLFGTVSGCWALASACFTSDTARWTAVFVASSVLAMPATNTGLLLFDPYLTARSFSTPLALIALSCFLKRRFAFALILTLLTASFHPQMVLYLVFLFAVIFAAERVKPAVAEPVPVMASVGVLPGGFHFAPATGPYREALYSRDYFFAYNWEWFHWVGVFAPLGILAWFWYRPFRGTTPAFRRVCLALIPFGLVSVVVAMVLASSTSFDMFERLQPMRTFHLITLIFMLLLGGFLGEYLVRGRAWVGAVLLVAISAGMFTVARQTYPNSTQIELPGMKSPNPWVSTLLWIRGNVPSDAVFAVDAGYLKDDITDTHGFRAISERSSLADTYKDSGVVSLFPDLADEWKRMSTATTGVNHFTQADFARLRGQYPQVSWTVIHGKAPGGLSCPYAQQGFVVCQMPIAWN